LPTTGQEQRSAAADEAPARTTDASSSQAAARYARELAPGEDSGDGEATPPSDSNPGSATDPDPPSSHDAAVTPNADATRQALDTLVRRIGGSEIAAASPAASGQAGGAAQVTQAASLALAAPAASAPETHAAATATASPPAVPIAGIAVEIAAQAQAGRSRFDIRLDPPELGRIDVRLDVDRDGKVTSRLVVDRPETLDILRRDASEIERSLQQAGLKTVDNNALQFSLRDNGTSGGFGNFSGHNPYPNNGSPGGSTRLIIPDRDLSPLDATAVGYGRAGGVGGIDIRV
jgi:flagellar hook-length control protein FliK